jgi:hypothetical protein
MAVIACVGDTKDVSDRGGATEMKAKFSSKCPGCGDRIHEGDNISKGDSGKYEHSGCAGSATSGYTHDEADYFAGHAEYDAEMAEVRRDNSEYMKGYHEVANIHAFAPAGSALREEMYFEMEMAAYNRGDD